MLGREGHMGPNRPLTTPHVPSLHQRPSFSRIPLTLCPCPYTTLGEHRVSAPNLNLITQLSAPEPQHQPCHMQMDDDTPRLSSWAPAPCAVSAAKKRTPCH